MRASYVEDTVIALFAGIIIAAVFGGFVVYKGSREVGYVTAKVLTPVIPKWGTSFIEYVPVRELTPNDRVKWGFYDLNPEKSLKMWASGNMLG